MKNLLETIIRNTAASVKIKITVMHNRRLDAGLNPVANLFGASRRILFLIHSLTRNVHSTIL